MAERTSSAVTGANGFVGGAIVRALEAEGHSVVRLQRSASDGPVRRFALGERPAPDLFDGVRTLVHCAYDFKASGEAEIARTNIDGSLALFEAAQAAGVERLVFVSSLSAFEGCRSLYGRAKLAVERQAGRLGLIVVRPGLVWGEASAGIVGQLEKAVGLSPLVPLIGRGDQIQFPAHEADVGRLVAKVCAGPEAPDDRPIVAATEQRETFRTIAEKLAAKRGRKPVFVPIPEKLVRLGLALPERLGLKLRLRPDSLTGLLNANAKPDFSATRRLGARFRPFAP